MVPPIHRSDNRKDFVRPFDGRGGPVPGGGAAVEKSMLVSACETGSSPDTGPSSPDTGSVGPPTVRAAFDSRTPTAHVPASSTGPPDGDDDADGSDDPVGDESVASN